MIRSITMITALVLVVSVKGIFSLESSDREVTWLGEFEEPMGLDVAYVEVHRVGEATERSKAGEGEPLFESLPAWLKDAFTSDGPPSETYVFQGGSGAVIDHVLHLTNSESPLTLSFAFAWQPCGNGVIFPPLPDLLGTTLDGQEMSITLPTTGDWYVAVGVRGFEPGDWDWMALVRYDGVTPIPVPPDEAVTDAKGGMPVAPWCLFGISPSGEGLTWERPWCFQVLP